MLVIYVVVVVPTGMLMKISNDPMHLKARDGTNCVQAHGEARTLETARRQF